MQKEAEKTQNAMTQILDNLPDAVLTFESDNLSYCNQQADNFFGVTLSQLNTDQTVLQNSQYKIMSNRCMHELNTSGVNKVAEKMMMTEDDGSKILNE